MLSVRWREDPSDGCENHRITGWVRKLVNGLESRLRDDGISVVGFDDIPEAQFFIPPLTTVRQDFMEMGRRSLHMLIGEIEAGTRSVRRETVAAKLIVRSSTGPASGG